MMRKGLKIKVFLKDLKGLQSKSKFSFFVQVKVGWRKSNR